MGQMRSAPHLSHNSKLPNGNLVALFLLLIVLVLTSACVCWRPSWTSKTQPGGSSAATSLSFWCSTRLLMPEKKCPTWRGKPCSVDFFIIPSIKCCSLPCNLHSRSSDSIYEVLRQARVSIKKDKLITEGSLSKTKPWRHHLRRN